MFGEINLKTFYKTVSDRPELVLGHTFFVVYILFCVIFYKERLLAFDSAYYCFKIIYYNDFNVEHGRWISVFSQFIPLLILKLGGSLKLFLIGYSINFCLVYYFLYVFVSHFLRSTIWALMIPMSLVLFTINVFYYPIAEVQMALVFLAVMLGWITRDRFVNIPLWLSGIVIYILIVIPANGYESVIMATIPALVVLWLLNKKFRSEVFLAIGLSLLVYGYEILSIPEGSYRSSKMVDFSALLHEFPNILNLYSLRYFKDMFDEIGISIALSVLGVIYLLVVKKKVVLTLVLAGGLIGYALFSVLLLYKGESPITMENYFYMIGFFIALIFCCFLQDFEGSKWKATMLIVIALAVCLRVISLQSDFYKERISFIKSRGEKCVTSKSNKVLVNFSKDELWGKLWVDWALASESLLISSLEGKEHSFTLYDHDYSNHDLENENLYLGPAFSPEMYLEENLNKSYFKLEGKYRICE